MARELLLGGMLDLWRGAAAQAAQELERAAAHAREAASLADERRSLGMTLSAHLVGPTPVAAMADPHVEDVRPRDDGRALEVSVLRVHAHVEAIALHERKGNVAMAESTRPTGGAFPRRRPAERRRQSRPASERAPSATISCPLT